MIHSQSIFVSDIPIKKNTSQKSLIQIFMKKRTLISYLYLVAALLCTFANAATITSPTITAVFTKTADATPLPILTQSVKFTFDFSSSSLTGSENLGIYFWQPASTSRITLVNEGSKKWSLTFTPTTLFNLSAAEIAENENQFYYNIEDLTTLDITGTLHTTFNLPASTSSTANIISNPLGTYPLDQSVIWSFDLTGSGFKAGMDIYMYAWSPTNPDPTYNNSTAISKLTYVSGMIWSKTLTPTTYFSQTIAQIQASAGFWMKLKDQSGKIETAAFSVPQTINRQLITISSSQTSTVLVNAFADVNVSGTGILTIDANRTIHDITIASGGKVTNNNGVTFTANNFTINSDASGTGTYVDNGTTTTGGTTSVNQYLSYARNWYVSSPVSNAQAPSGYTYYKRDETGSNPSPVAPATAYWVNVPTGTVFAPAIGYSALPTADGQTLTFSTQTGGSLNSLNSPVSVALTWSGASYKGYNLIGNPYPCHLSWTTAFVDDLTNAALINPSIWYRTNAGTTNASGQWSFQTFNAHSGQGVPSGVTGIIPPMQAFW